MAAINDLISQIQDAELRERIQKEVNKLSKQKKFGLVFEEHMPECTPLYDMPIRRGCNVMLRDGKEDKSVYVVVKIENDTAICVKRDNQEEAIAFALKDIIRIAEFGETIYPYLKPLDTVCNNPDSELWHMLIEADNYHALQLLEYLYTDKVDCIYIDPPYNTGAKDWKYNNDYVDSKDTYRHSKWLSMMEKRLKIAGKLLNHQHSVMIVTIDEKEYLYLGCLLEELFPDARIQMISSVINPQGAVRAGDFSRTNEYIFFVMFGDAGPSDLVKEDQKGDEDVHWCTLRRTDLSSVRLTRPRQFYPIYVNDKTRRIDAIGEPLKPDENRDDAPMREGCTAVFPVRPDGTEMNWGITGPELMERARKGYVKVGRYTPDEFQKYTISYLKAGPVKDIESGKAVIIGYDDVGAVKCCYVEKKGLRPTTQWEIKTHDAYRHGTNIIGQLLGKGRFTFPKSIYAVKDAIGLFVKDNPSALVIDFFAGSGTTHHAVNLLNSEDGGKRRCILVTNNEVSETERTSLTQQGYQPGDDYWESFGVARYVTWPRTVCSIEGHDINGQALKGNYIGLNTAMSDGFKTNAQFFQLGFLDKTAIALGFQFKEMLPTLWMKANCVGKCPLIEGDSIPPMLILPENKMAILINENAFAAFEKEVSKHSEIQTVFLATDYDVNYRAMAKNLNVERTYQLYRDYLDHFRLNRGRN